MESVMSSHTHYQELMMKAVDGFLSAEEAEEWDAHLGSCEVCAQEFAAFADIQAHTTEYRQRMLYEYRAMDVRRSGAAVKGVGLTLLGGGYLTLVASSLGLMVLDPGLPLWIKVSTGAVVLGLGLLFGKVVADRMRTLKSDTYMEVDR